MASGTERDYAAEFRRRRKEAGWRKLSFYLQPEEAALLSQLKCRFGTDEATVKAALALLATQARGPQVSFAEERG